MDVKDSEQRACFFMNITVKSYFDTLSYTKPKGHSFIHLRHRRQGQGVSAAIYSCRSPVGWKRKICWQEKAFPYVFSFSNMFSEYFQVKHFQTCLPASSSNEVRFLCDVMILHRGGGGRNPKPKLRIGNSSTRFSLSVKKHGYERLVA